MTEAGSERSFDDAEALAWLRSQPGGTVNASAAQLARTWGWNRVRAGRRLRAWQTIGYIQRNGHAITVNDDETAGVTDAVTESVTAVTADHGVTEGVTEAVTDAVTEPVTAATTDRRVTVGVTEAVTDAVTRVAPVSAVKHRRTPVTFAPIGEHLTLSAAVALTSVSAAFSIDGLTAIFAGAFWPVLAMGIALEVGKLVATAWLRENWRTAPWALRTGLAAMIAVLMALNAVGVFGFLTRAHLERQLAIEVVAADRAAEIEARLLVQGELLADLDRRIRQIDAAIEESTRRGQPAVAMALGNSLHRARAQLSDSRQQEAQVVAALQVEKAKVAAQSRRASADIGPVRYLAELVAGPSVDLERAVRVLTLAIVAVFDPFAIMLLVAATGISAAPH
jgi:hypothetical protein